MTLDEIKALAIWFVPVGSRVTCNPPPKNTDADYLVYVKDRAAVGHKLFMAGWDVGGSTILPSGASVPTQFHSFTQRDSDVNVIITDDADFAHRFMAATSVAKRLNLMDKADRIALFQAVLYGNFCT